MALSKSLKSLTEPNILLASAKDNKSFELCLCWRLPAGKNFSKGDISSVGLRPDEWWTLETSPLKTPYGWQFKLSTQKIKNE